MAARYWVGGTASWDGTAGTKWALTSGGAGGQAIPTAADDVFFSSLSTGTCTIATGNTGAKSINCTGFTGTLAGTVAIIVSGSITLVAGMTYSYTGQLSINGTGTITSAGKTFNTLIIDGAGIIVTLGDAFTTTGTAIGTSIVALTRGTLELAGFTLTCGSFNSSTTNTRAISFGTGGITLTNQSSATVLSMATMTNFSWTGSAGTEGFSYTRSTATGTGTITTGSTAGGTVSNAVNVTLRAQTNNTTIAIFAGSYIKNLTVPTSTPTLSISTGASYNACGNLEITDPSFLGSSNLSPTFLASGTLRSAGNTLGNVTVNAPGGTVTLSGGALALGVLNTFTLTAGTVDLANFTLSTGAFSSNNSNTRAIAFGSANIVLWSTVAGTTVLSMANATNFTYTGTGGFTRNSAAASTMVFGTTGGSTTNAPTLAVNAGSGTVSFTSGSWFKTLNFIGMTGGSILGTVNLAGNLTLTPSASYSNFFVTFRATASFNTLGVIQFGGVTVNGAGITVTLSNSGVNNPVTSLILTEGTLNITTNFNAATFSSNNSNVRALTLTAGILFTISGSGASAWNTATSTNLTFTPNTATISMTSASAKTFAGGDLTYYNLRQGGAGTLTVSGSNTFNNITNTVQPATVTFTAGTTQTVSAFGLSGTAGNLLTINSTSPGSQATLSKSSGQVVAQYLSIRDSNATGGASWIARESVDVSNNTGWNFINNSPGMLALFV